MARAAIACMPVLALTLTTIGAAAQGRVRSAARHTERAVAVPMQPVSPLQIVVSLRQQKLTVFDGAAAVLTTGISSGQSGHETPTGIYSILQKRRHHESNIYSDAPMPYMQRITWSGIALHQGHLPGYPASHGCIRLPGAVASQLFAMTKIGARVIVSKEPLTPRAIEHETLADVGQRPAAVAALMAPSTTTDGAAKGGAAMTASGGLLITSAAASEPPPDPPRTASAAEGQIAILISRRTGKIYIRRNFEPLYEGPVIIRDPDVPLGTHLYTAVDANEDRTQLAWSVVSLAMPEPAASRRRREAIVPVAVDTATGSHPTASTTLAGAALDRIELEPDLIEEIAEVARPGISIIITDQGPGPETGKGTEFVIQPR